MILAAKHGQCGLGRREQQANAADAQQEESLRGKEGSLAQVNK
jgi:hypothetical protein